LIEANKEITNMKQRAKDTLEPIDMYNRIIDVQIIDTNLLYIGARPFSTKNVPFPFQPILFSTEFKKD